MPNYLRPLTQVLTPDELDAANAVLHRHGLETHTDKPRLIDILMAIAPCPTDTFISVATAVRDALDALENNNDQACPSNGA